MRQFVDIAVFWAVVLVGICVLARFPGSWLARILFARLGPLPIRGELRSRYLLRWALFGAGWFAQATLVLAIGAVALHLQPWLAESLYFLVFWVVVVPLLATVALSGSLLAVGAALWRRYIGAERRAGSPSHAVQA
jgi:hypothetical protein